MLAKIFNNLAALFDLGHHLFGEVFLLFLDALPDLVTYEFLDFRAGGFE